MVLCDNVHYRVILATGGAHYLFDSLGLYGPVHEKVWPHTGNHGSLLRIPLTPQGDAHSCRVYGWYGRCEYSVSSRQTLRSLFRTFSCDGPSKLGSPPPPRWRITE